MLRLKAEREMQTGEEKIQRVFLLLCQGEYEIANLLLFFEQGRGASPQLS